MLPLEGDEEVKKGKGLKIPTPNKLLTRLPILLVQIKAGNNSATTRRPRDVPYKLLKGPNVRDLQRTFIGLSGDQYKN